MSRTCLFRERATTPGGGTFVVLRRFGEGVSAVQTFAVVSNGFGVFTPQWSPDGNRLLLKVGTQGDSISRYLIYLWNPQRGRIQQGPKEEIAYLQPRWSPDSARIAYVVGRRHQRYQRLSGG